MHGTDYTLSPNGHGELKLTLKDAFLKKNEHGKADLNPSIKLYSTDGRNFGTHSFKLRVNTPPLKADYKGCVKKDNVYVLVFEVPNMPGYPIEGTDRLHSDVDKVWIQKGHGASFEHPITLNGTTGFNPPESQDAQPFCLIKRDGITALTSGDVEGVSLPDYPSHGSWFLYLKTDTPIKAGKTDYKVRIKDKKGLYSGEVTLSTPGNTIAPVTVTLVPTTGTTSVPDLSDENTSNAAYLITAKSGQNNVQLTMSTSTTTASLRCEVKKVGSDETVFSSTVSNPITVNLPVPTDSYEETYKAVIRATAAGLPQTTKTIYYKVRGRTITVKTWKELKEAVKNTEIDTIKVTTTITAAASGNNRGEIEVNRNSNETVTIKGGGTIDANEQNRIFLVQNANTLILNNLTLQNGKLDSGESGGAVRINNGGTLIINNVIIKDCKAVPGNGGGISSSGNFTMKGNSSIKDCNAVNGGAVYIVNGNFSMYDDAMITPSTGALANTPGENDVYLINNTKISMDSSLSQSGIVARITPQPYNTVTQVLAGSGLASGYEKFTVTDEPILNIGIQKWKIKNTGKLTKDAAVIPFDKLGTYLGSPHASAAEVNLIKVTGLTNENLKGTSTPTPGSPSDLGVVLNDNSDKQVSLILPERVEDLTDMSFCFYGCTSLIEVSGIPKGVENMGSCFRGCSNLTKVPVLPLSVKNMTSCFLDCTSLTQAPNIPVSVTNMSNCFRGCTSLIQAPIIQAKKVTSMEACFSDCTSLAQAPVIPASVKNMSYCFYGCTALAIGPDIPESVTNMQKCFENCSSMRSVKLYCDYNSYNINGSPAFNNAFSGCSALEEGGIKVPSGQLGTYRSNATTMGTTANKFSGF
ncbi:leucine-rich repeat protein [Treponema sp. OMZ 799]|uniref:leucine-rich repeat protein n=1 Tax=Treponema sp. OMZ 799 TaxID=2563668 RepID=UPI0020A294C1|nr:leucine-rich repeat protein [Treponema sp. OMZ 799]UTC78347.1 leucine-rich repeat protein [Treponema sp. OMZ 799]